MNDNHLIDDLGATFRKATRDIVYTGPVPSPRSSLRTVLPVALSVPLVATGVSLAVLSSGPVTQPTDIPPSAAPGSPSDSAAQPEADPVRKTFKLAGQRLTITQNPGRAPMYGTYASSVPIDATEVRATVFEGQAYLGTDPATGQNAVFVTAPGSSTVWVLTSADVTREELEQIINAETIQPVPVQQ